jgi:hypothetical protein
MRDDLFEWDDRKSACNLRKHGVSFEAARLVFEDPMAVDDLEEDEEDERYWRVGMARGTLLFVIYAMRGGRS